MVAIEKFYIGNKVVIITGGAGLLGRNHAEAVIEGKGIPILIDISRPAINNVKASIADGYGTDCKIDGYVADITKWAEIEQIADDLLKRYGHVDVLINNVANNPKVEGSTTNMKAIQFENFPLQIWLNDTNVGLAGAFYI